MCAALPNPVLPKTQCAAAVKKVAALLPAVHTCRFDAQQARVIAVLRSAGVEHGHKSPRAVANERKHKSQIAFFKAKKTAALRAMDEHVRYTGMLLLAE